MRTHPTAAWMILIALLPAAGVSLSEIGAPANGAGAAQPAFEAGLRLQSQSPASKDFSLKLNVDLVTADATVRDKNGTIIGDLHADDFLVYDNGVVQTLTHFSLDQLPLAVALVIDRSPSISRYLDDLRSAGLAALEHLKPQDQVALYAFDYCPDQITDLTQDRRLVAAKVGEIKIGNSTNIYSSIFESARFLRENAPNHRKAILLISDNCSTVFPMEEQDVLTQVLESSATLISIRTPGDNAYCEEASAVERIAKESGGEVIKLGNSEKLSAALDHAISNLRMGYTLGFMPSEVGKSGSFHKLAVRLIPAKPCPGCRVQARTGYYAGSQAGSRSRMLIGKTQPPYNCAEYLSEIAARRRMWVAAEAEADYRQVSLRVSTESASDDRGKPQIKVGLLVGPGRHHIQIIGRTPHRQAGRGGLLWRCQGKISRRGMADRGSAAGGRGLPAGATVRHLLDGHDSVQDAGAGYQGGCRRCVERPRSQQAPEHKAIIE